MHAAAAEVCLTTLSSRFTPAAHGLTILVEVRISHAVRIAAEKRFCSASIAARPDWESSLYVHRSNERNTRLAAPSSPLSFAQACRTNFAPWGTFAGNRLRRFGKMFDRVMVVDQFLVIVV